ncbi:MAG: hypothetical protein EBR09_04880 [Proteobacteria bacterium]|nr:hypothetical protein [Pseudomonadota bacterium]
MEGFFWTSFGSIQTSRTFKFSGDSVPVGSVLLQAHAAPYPAEREGYGRLKVEFVFRIVGMVMP